LRNRTRIREDRTISRRGFLASTVLAGVSAATSGPVAAPQDSRRRIPARFVGDGLERGHHWISLDAAKLRVDRTEKKSVVIVGAGIAGMVAAWRLLEARVDDFVVLELEDKAGGLARNGLMGNTLVPFGGVAMRAPGPMTSPPVARLLQTGGGVRERTPVDSRVFATTRPGDLDGITVSQLEADEALAAMRTEWCLRRFGARASDVSAEAFLRDAAGRRDEVLAVPGGLASLLDPLVPKVGARLLTARVAVLAQPEGATARVRAVNANDAVVTDYEAGAAILALPPFIIRKIAPALFERDKDVALPETTPWLVTATMVSRWPKGFDPKAPFRRASDERASLIVHAGEPPEGILVCHRPFPASAATPSRMFLRDLDRDGAREWAFRELAPVFPDLADVAVRVELWRVAHGPTRPVPGWLTKTAPRLRQPMPPLYPCGADLGGVPSAESAITDGVRGAEAALQALGKLDESWL
jgi:glycine/D-amino acid oxidase-like deaminating enzyme